MRRVEARGITMGYTFGAATGDDINGTINQQHGGDNSVALIGGWFYPTSQTNGRYFMSFGAAHGIKYSASSNNLFIVTDNATNDGQFQTTSGLVPPNKWSFIAALTALENTGVLAGIRVWVGDASTPPVENTLSTVISPTGNFAASAAMTIGNGGAAGTVSFQGDIDSVFALCTTTVGVANMFSVATSGVISDTEAENTYRRWVVPIWRGRPSMVFFTPTVLTSQRNAVCVDLDTESPRCFQTGYSTSPDPVSMTINGATYTAHRGPRRLPHNWVHRVPVPEMI